MIEIVVESGVAKERCFKTAASSLTVGRATDNDIVIRDAFVSRHHGEITLLSDAYTYKDLNSTHGTRLVRAGEERSVHEMTLKAGDRLILGSVENVLSVASFQLEDAAAPPEDITILHSPANRLVRPEEYFATDTDTLRAIVEFDTRLANCSSTEDEDLLHILLEYVPRLYSGEIHAAILLEDRQGIRIYAALTEESECHVRTSSTILGLVRQNYGSGIVYEVSEGSAIVAGQTAGRLSDESLVGRDEEAGTLTGICLPLDAIGLTRRYLIFERAASQGVFSADDLGLVQSLAYRVMGRIENNRLIRDNQRLSVTASMGVFASMIGHDIKNYLFYSKSISDIHEDPLIKHPGLVRGIERARKLAHGMKDLAAPGVRNVEDVDAARLVRDIAGEFQTLFGTECSFSTRVPSTAVMIRTNEDLLSRILWNLVMNAYHAMQNRRPNTTAQPEVATALEKSGETHVRIEVKDNAGGIREETLTYLWRSIELIEQLYRQDLELINVVNEVANMKGYTNSIGIFFTLIAANDLGASVEVDSVIGEGTRFWLTVPIECDHVRSVFHTMT